MISQTMITERYRPKTISELVGNREAIRALVKWLNEWRDKSYPKKKAALLIGPAGVGKTSAVYAIANDLGFHVIEVNASDTRNSEAINRIIGNAAASTLIDQEGRGKIILVDEVDGIQGTFDRGGLASLKKIIKSTRYPLVLTANDPESSKIDQLRRVVEVIQFHRANEIEIFKLLQHIATTENTNIDNAKLQIISEISQGDIRAALNEFESARNIDVEFEQFVAQYVGNNRSHQTTVLEAVQGVFLADSPEEARTAMSSVPTSDYSWLLRTMVEAIVLSNEPDIVEKATLLADIAEADLVLSRIWKRNQWRLLKYFFFNLGYQLATHKKTRISVHELRFPQLYATMGRFKRVTETLKRISEHISRKFHLSPKKTRHEMIPVIKVIVEKDPVAGAEILADLDITDDEISAFLTKETAEKIFQHIEDAREKVGISRIQDSVDEEPAFYLVESSSRKKKKERRVADSQKKKEEQKQKEQPQMFQQEERKEKKEKKKQETSEQNEKQRTLDDFF